MYEFGAKYTSRSGIPIGSDTPPFMPNLFLYYYEDKLIRITNRKELVIARQFVIAGQFDNVSQCIDDLTDINVGRESKEALNEILPPALELKMENASLFIASFLDLDIKTSNKKNYVKSL